MKEKIPYCYSTPEKQRQYEELLKLKSDFPHIPIPDPRNYPPKRGYNQMEEMNEIEALCEAVFLELTEIKMHICNERHFEGGVALGGLINSVINRQYKEQKARKENEKVQKERHDKECEESSEEEDSDSEDEDEDDEYDTDETYLIKNLKGQLYKCNADLIELRQKDEERSEGINKLNEYLADLHDFLLDILRLETYPPLNDDIINLLQETGVAKVDIKIRGNQKQINPYE